MSFSVHKNDVFGFLSISTPSKSTDEVLSNSIFAGPFYEKDEDSQWIEFWRIECPPKYQEKTIKTSRLSIWPKSPWFASPGFK